MRRLLPTVLAANPASHWCCVTCSSRLGDGIEGATVSLSHVSMALNGSKPLIVAPRLDPKGTIPLQRIKCLELTWEGGVDGINELEPTYVDLLQDPSLETTKEAETEENKEKPSIESALNLFQKAEILDPSEAWYCDVCKEHREATKSTTIWSAPPILVLGLKRFEFRNVLWKDKLDFMVDYPIKGLDMTKYVAEYKGDEPLLYDLYAVVNHHGLIWGGHYTAECLSPADAKWRLFNDSRVTDSSEKKVRAPWLAQQYYRSYSRVGVISLSPAAALHECQWFASVACAQAVRSFLFGLIRT